MLPTGYWVLLGLDLEFLACLPDEAASAKPPGVQANEANSGASCTCRVSSRGQSSDAFAILRVRVHKALTSSDSK